MAPASKRSSQRTRRVRDVSPSPALHDISSPSRPSKRRKKAEPEPPLPSDPVEEEGSSLTVDPTNDGAAEAAEADTSAADDALITQLTECLASIPTQADRDHANAKHESKGDIEAYAKIAAKEWTYYVKQLNINLGRNSEPTSGPPNAVDADDESYVHIDLGPSKVFSRKTARIYYDTGSEKWFLQVKGRNGLKVNGAPLKRDDGPHRLSSGDVVEVGGLEMMFVLPSTSEPLTIHSMFLQRIGHGPPALKGQRSSPAPETRHALPAPSSSSADPAASGNAPGARPASSRGSFPQPIAPAPVDYKRPGTPPSVKSRIAVSSHHKSPAYGSAGTLLLNHNDVDYSLDENKHLKPSYSYAQMITQAIMQTADQKLTLNGIYRYITDNYAYYRTQPPGGWQNSIRHNLSLNKSFLKVSRATNEPGKGMKWEIVADQREEMARQAWKSGRGGHRGSSAPSSPSQPQLNYITQGPRDMASSRATGSARKRKAASPTVGSPQPSSAIRRTSQMTPERTSRYQPGPASFQDGSPLPRPRKALNPTASFPPDTLPRSPPTLTSSYLNDENASLITPAPQRLQPRLAPPSTAQRPSQHMPTSSPAPFWKYADIGSTPLKSMPFDISPSKPSLKLPLPLPLPTSSSPPPVADDSGSRSPVASPSRSPVRGDTQETATVVDEEIEEEGGFDLTKGFQSIGAYHSNGRGPQSRCR